MATLSFPASGGLNNAPKTRRTCTHCGSDEIFRQRAQGIIECHLLSALGFVPYWCAACDTYFYLRVRSVPPRPI